MASPALEDVVARYRSTYARLRAGAGSRVVALWDRLGGPDDAAAERFIAAAVPVVSGAQVATVRLLAGYLSTIARMATGEAAQVAVAAEELAAGARAGAPLREVYRRPVVDLRTGIARQTDYMTAFAKARARAEVLAQTDVALAQRAGTTELLGRDRRVRGYRRVLSGASCPLCAQAAADTYSPNEPMPLHGRCDCGVAPIYSGATDLGARSNRRRLENLEAAGPLPGVAVHRHGELGPVLTEAEHGFTSSSALP